MTDYKLIDQSEAEVFLKSSTTTLDGRWLECTSKT